MSAVKHYAKEKLWHSYSKALLKAAQNGDVDAAVSAVKKGGKGILYATDNKGNTALHLAAVTGGLRMVEQLLDLGGDPLCVNERGMTATKVAIDTGVDNKVILTLNAAEQKALKSFEDPRLNVKYKQKTVAYRPEMDNTALHLATAKGDIALIDDMIGAGGNPYICGRRKKTLLHQSIGSNKPETLEFVWELGGFDIDAIDGMNQAPIAYVVSNVKMHAGHLGHDPENIYSRGENEHASLTMLRFLLDWGANPVHGRGHIDTGLHSLQRMRDSFTDLRVSKEVADKIESLYKTQYMVREYLMSAGVSYEQTRLQYDAKIDSDTYQDPHAIPDLRTYCVHSLYVREQKEQIPMMSEEEDKIVPPFVKRTAIAPAQRRIQAIIANRLPQEKESLVGQSDLIALERRAERAQKAGENWQAYTQKRAYSSTAPSANL